jgi:hypothetical protein
MHHREQQYDSIKSERTNGRIVKGSQGKSMMKISVKSRVLPKTLKNLNAFPVQKYYYKFCQNS